MDQRVSVITLGVQNLNRARKFYEEGLGWRASQATGGSIVVYKAGNLLVTLFPRDELAADAGLRNAGKPGAFDGMTLAYNAGSRDLVDMVMTQAETAGATITKRAQEAFWGGYSGAFRDLDGHTWEVAWNPHWFDSDGNVSLPD